MGTSKDIVIRICETILIFVVILVGFSLSKDKHHAWGVADLLPTDCGIFAYLSGLTRREWATDAGVTFFPNGCCLGFETLCRDLPISCCQRLREYKL